MAARKAARPWTESEERLLETLRLEGFWCAALAAVLDRTACSCRMKLNRLGVRMPSRYLKILGALTADRPAADVARALGTTPAAVWNARHHLRRSGFALPDRRRRKRREEP